MKLTNLLFCILLFAGTVQAQSFGYTTDPTAGTQSHTSAREYCAMFTTGTNAEGGQIDSIRVHQTFNADTRANTWCIRGANGLRADSLLATQTNHGKIHTSSEGEVWVVDTNQWNDIGGGLHNSTNYYLCMMHNQVNLTTDYDNGADTVWSFSNTSASGIPTTDPANFDLNFDFVGANTRQMAIEIWFTVSGSSPTSQVIMIGDN